MARGHADEKGLIFFAKDSVKKSEIQQAKRVWQTQ